jgi:hypothetical protein
VATVVPNVPTDSLYKFVAIFGIILLGFGLWLPERFVAAYDRERGANEALQLAQIRVDRKKVQSDRALEEFKKKSAAVREKLKTSMAENAALRAKNKALGDELERISRNPNASTAKDIKGLKGDIKRMEDIKHRSDAIVAEMQPVDAKINQNIAEQQALDEEFKPLRVQLEEVTDDLDAESVKLKNDTQVMEGLIEQAILWSVISVVTLLVGIVMIVKGFRLWYVKVQVFQDAILRREAGGLEQDRND